MLVQPYNLDLPSGWDTAALRYLANVETGSGDTQDADPDGQYPFIVRSPSPMASAEFSYDTEAVLTAGDGNVGEIFHHIKGKFHAHQRVYVISGFKRVTPRYFYYFFSSHFRHMAKGGEARTTVDSVRRWMITDMPFAVPPIEVQNSISDYLDRETQKIDELITEQCGLIETLRERRVELIAKGVTRGIDDEPLSELPMPWIGAIPRGWSNGRIKHLGQVTLGKMLQSQSKQGYVEAPYMRAANIQPDGVVSDSDFKTMWFSPSELRSLDLCQGDVVVVEGGVGGYGRAAFLSKSLHGWGYQNSVNRIRPFGDGRFIAYYLQAVRAKGLIKAYCNIVSMPHLTAEKLESMPVPIPPDDEQCRIANYLDDQTSRIDELISESEDLIALSQERRSALITAAVNGQIDVRATA